ncbi:MAG: DUF4125 family protein [Desulfobacterales bacterium]
MERKILIDKILNIEFYFFDQVRSNALLSCTADEDDFFNQRRAQFVPWGSYTLKSYLSDLELALKEKTNPVAQKYLCMGSSQPMKATNPHIDQIVERNLAWQTAMMAQYPHFMSQGRALTDGAGEVEEVAFDNYLRCELASFSTRTVRLLHADIEQMHQMGINMCEVIYDALVKQYGYPSLSAAEAAMRNASSKSPEL